MAIKIQGEIVITDTEDLTIDGNATIGGNSYVGGDTIVVGMLEAEHIVSTDDMSVGNELVVGGNATFNGTIISGDDKEMLKYDDTWLRLNNSVDFSSGTYTPGNFLINGFLTVNGPTTLAGDVTLNKDYKLDTGECPVVDVYFNASVNGNVGVCPQGANWEPSGYAVIESAEIWLCKKRYC